MTNGRGKASLKADYGAHSASVGQLSEIGHLGQIFPKWPFAEDHLLSTKGGRNNLMMIWHFDCHHDEVHSRMCEQFMMVVEGGRNTKGSRSGVRGVATAGTNCAQIVFRECFEGRNMGRYGPARTQGTRSYNTNTYFFS